MAPGKSSSSAKKRALHTDRLYEELDKISQLPEPLIDKILSLLPIKDAVRTSIVSSKWRYKWTTLAKLVFNDECISFSGDVDLSSVKLVKIIDRVLMLHSGSIAKFTLSHKQYEATSDIDLWILYLSKASIRELTIDVWKGAPYKVPSSLFSCQSLTSLELYNSSINIPPTFRGFKNLKSLYFDSIPLSQQVLENLVSGSPLLEKLNLYPYHFRDLIIDAPKLESLIFTGVLEGISLKNTYCSPSFHMDFDQRRTRVLALPAQNAVTSFINLLNFFAPLRNVEILRLDGDVLKYLSVQEAPAILSEPFLRLETLVINVVNFNSVKEISVILCLLRSAPNLKHVKFSATRWKEDEDTVGGDVEMYDSPYTFAHLNSASLVGIRYSALEVGFIGVLLSSSPALQKMTIKASEGGGDSSGDYKLLKSMLRVQWCTMTRAQVIFLDP